MDDTEPTPRRGHGERGRGERGHGERGANLVEYCLLIALIVLACIAGVSAFGKAVPGESFSSVSVSI